jgi:hypothetical protein
MSQYKQIQRREGNESALLGILRTQRQFPGKLRDDQNNGIDPSRPHKVYCVRFQESTDIQASNSSLHKFCVTLVSFYSSFQWKDESYLTSTSPRKKLARRNTALLNDFITITDNVDDHGRFSLCRGEAYARCRH